MNKFSLYCAYEYRAENFPCEEGITLKLISNFFLFQKDFFESIERKLS